MTHKPTKKGKKARRTSLEKEYKQLFDVDTSRIVTDNQSLVQQTPYQTVRTFTTYSAYEDPI